MLLRLLSSLTVVVMESNARRLDAQAVHESVRDPPVLPVFFARYLEQSLRVKGVQIGYSPEIFD